MTARSVVKRYPNVAALEGASVEVAAGRCLALVGESGSGKTTLLRCFNRLVEPDSGEVLVGDIDVRRADPIALRRHSGYVPQEGGLLPHWTVRRNVSLVPWLLGESDARAMVDEALALVGLDGDAFGERYPHELSGGQRQRVAMARALAARPATLLLDEPFGALDAITRSDLQEMFIEVRRRRPVTCVLVTHDLREALRLADHIAVMRAGRLEQHGEARTVITSPATDYVRTLVEKAMGGNVVEAPGSDG